MVSPASAAAGASRIPNLSGGASCCLSLSAGCAHLSEASSVPSTLRLHSQGQAERCQVQMPPATTALACLVHDLLPRRPNCSGKAQENPPKAKGVTNDPALVCQDSTDPPP